MHCYERNLNYFIDDFLNIWFCLQPQIPDLQILSYHNKPYINGKIIYYLCMHRHDILQGHFYINYFQNKSFHPPNFWFDQWRSRVLGKRMLLWKPHSETDDWSFTVWRHRCHLTDSPRQTLCFSFWLSRAFDCIICPGDVTYSHYTTLD